MVPSSNMKDEKAEEKTQGKSSKSRYLIKPDIFKKSSILIALVFSTQTFPSFAKLSQQLNPNSPKTYFEEIILMISFQKQEQGAQGEAQV